MDNGSFCRLCAGVVKGDFKYIFSPENENLLEKLNNCLPIVVKKTDPFPKQICNTCIQAFNSFHNFYYQVIEAEKKLKSEWRKVSVSKKNLNQCIDCPLCKEGNIGVKDGKILLSTGTETDDQKELGLVDNECLTKMIQKELEKDVLLMKKSADQFEDPNYEYVCFTCGEGFLTEEEISKHDCMKSSTFDNEQNPDNKTGTKIQRLKADIPAQCDVCGKIYKNLRRLNDHLSFCHPQVYHKCNECEKQFPKKWLLTTHMRKHTGELPFTCSKCNKGFITNSHLRNHINFHHNEKNYKCNDCRATGFYSKQDLENHIRTKHTKERTLHCDVCNKSFMSTGVFYQHRLIHTDLKKYSCAHCGKKFRRWWTLRNHIRIHKHERPFVCEHCGRAFRQKNDLKIHQATQHRSIIK